MLRLCDGATNLKRLAGLGYEHQRFVGLDSKEPAHVNLPGVLPLVLKRVHVSSYGAGRSP